ncbi:FAR1 domain-containing protein/MULE domain-containing protein [Cephalotus follicularis]|uniref:Protein FAR1-RELATED SEQUENCE n=1 Tax=Cephalotus follicularis TaxID=3775 RepID=A0A1Q3BWX2_CEPFO|nr:FAR1 domain-containing protein/MULE domain-containing protein [Cephalotus follicularis]
MNRDDDDLDCPHDVDMEVRFQTSNDLDLNVDQDCHSARVAHANASLSSDVDTDEDEVLKIGTEFESDEHAYRFYNKYASLVGFSVRKDWVNRSKIHGQVVSRKYTCSREGYRQKDKRDVNVKKHRKETRTGCLAHMIITRQPDGKYRVTHFEAKHNHDNLIPINALILPLRKELSDVQATEADVPDNSETRSNSALEDMDRRWGVQESLDSLAIDYDNYLQSERIRDLKKGEAGHLLHYFQRQHFENPSFFYALQLDIDDKVSNIFWADDDMVVDYDLFGDVVCLDTTCRTNKDFQPFVQFIGVNHHNQAVIFAAALLFDDTVESLKWLFHTFLGAVSGKKPKVILTDQDSAIVEAIYSVLPESDHRICIWQMYDNAIKHLCHVVKDIESFATDFRSCIYYHKDEEGFIHAWEALLEDYDLQQNEWLRWMFREKEKWGVVYGRNTFFVDMKTMHLGENLSNKFRSYLNSDQDLIQFFRHFERVLDEIRYKEIEADDEMSRCMPRLMGNVVLLRHASESYTPKAFEIFQREYEKCLNVVVKQCSPNGLLTEYKVNTFGQTREYTVTFNSSDDTVICECMKFQYVGFLCSHALKVLDQRNIKVVPSRYISKRWTKEARVGSVKETIELIEQENPKLGIARRYKVLCRRLLIISTRAAASEEAFQFASRKLDEVSEVVEKILTLNPEETVGINSGSTIADASESENAEVCLERNAVEDQDECNRVQGTKGKDSAFCKLRNVNERSYRTDIVQNVRSHSPTTVSGISSSPARYVTPEAATQNSAMLGLYNFEVSQVVQDMLQQPNLIMDQQPNFYTDQHDSPGHTQLLHEPLIPNTYHESVSDSIHLRQIQSSWYSLSWAKVTVEVISSFSFINVLCSL